MIALIAEIPPPTTSTTTTAASASTSAPLTVTTRRQTHLKNRKKGLRLRWMNKLQILDGFHTLERPAAPEEPARYGGRSLYRQKADNLIHGWRGNRWNKCSYGHLHVCLVAFFNRQVARLFHLQVSNSRFDDWHWRDGTPCLKIFDVINKPSCDLIFCYVRMCEELLLCITRICILISILLLLLYHGVIWVNKSFALAFLQ